MSSSPSTARSGQVAVSVLDANAPWIRSILQSLPPRASVSALRVYSPRTFKDEEGLTGVRSLLWRSPGPGYRERVQPVPSLQRYPGVSSAIVGGAARLMPRPDVLICTNPWHVENFRRIEAGLKIYYPSDAFEFYAWPRDGTRAREQEALNVADVVLAMAAQQRDDFAARTTTEVRHFPNAVDRTFVSALLAEPGVPRELRSHGFAGVVGCTGRINDTYDWEFIDGLVNRLPRVLFVFVGPVTPYNLADPDRVLSTLRKPNVLWTGERRHEELPQYLAAFDVCLNPLLKNEHNDRRCPLRLFDYLATDAAIVSTPVQEAHEFGQHVQLAADAEEAAGLVRDALEGRRALDLPGRRTWLESNTWHARGEQLFDLALARLGGERAPSGGVVAQPDATNAG